MDGLEGTPTPLLLASSVSEEIFFQAFRHLYVLATEARWIQTVDVDTGLPVYAPLEITVRETDHHVETSFCEVTPCLLPERAVVSLCGCLLPFSLVNLIVVHFRVSYYALGKCYSSFTLSRSLLE